MRNINGRFFRPEQNFSLIIISKMFITKDVIIATFKLIMNLTLKNRAADKAALLEKMMEFKFMSLNSISKQLKDRIEPHLHRKKTIINRLENTKKPEISIHKHSIETTTSYLSTCHHTAEKKKKLSVDNPEHIIIKESLEQLKGKNSHYAIRWSKPASLVTKQMRVMLGEWLSEVSKELLIPKNVVYNAMHYVDKYVEMVNVPRKYYQITGLCALFIACKLQISAHPSAQTFLEAIDGICSKPQFFALEQSMVLKLKFRLNPPTLFQYMVLLVSLFNHFVSRQAENYMDAPQGSQLYKDIFWVLDGVHLENEYKSIHNKEKVCLSILFICLKKERMKRLNLSRLKLYCDLENLSAGDQTEIIFEKFLNKIVKVVLKIAQLKEPIRLFRKWVKHDRSSVNEQEQNELLKRIILAQ